MKLGHRAAVAEAGRSGEHLEVHSLMASVARAHAIKFGLAQHSCDAAAGGSSPDVAFAGGISALSSVLPYDMPFCQPAFSEYDLEVEPRDEQAPVTPRVACFPSTPEWSRGL